MVTFIMQFCLAHNPKSGHFPFPATQNHLYSLIQLHLCNQGDQKQHAIIILQHMYYKV